MAELQTSPLAHLDPAAGASAAPEAAAVRLSVEPFRGQLCLRGGSDDRAFAQKVKASVGLDLPVEPLTSTVGKGGSLLWLGPDEWLLVAPYGTEGTIQRALEGGLAGLHHAVVDVTDSRVVIAVMGRAAWDLLAKGCGLDLHPDHFPVGRCAQTHFARAHALIHRLPDGSDGHACFELYVHRSFCEYAWLWLIDAGLEFGVAVAEPVGETR